MTSSLAFADLVTDIPQPGPDPNTGDPAGLVSVSGIPFPPDSCWRVRVKFGKKPETGSPSAAECRIGKCGDIGHEAVSFHPQTITCLAGVLVGGEEVAQVESIRTRGSVRVSWSVASEIRVTGYNIYVQTVKGALRKVNDVPLSCAECTSGAPASYEYVIPAIRAINARAVVVETLSAARSRSAPAAIR